MGDKNTQNLSPEDIYDEMEVLEPYTTGELASYFGTPRQHIRNLLKRLSNAGKVRKKEPKPNRAIWIREAPVHECPNCGYRYEVKFLHPVLSAVQFCPQCGTQV